MGWEWPWLPLQAVCRLDLPQRSVRQPAVPRPRHGRPLTPGQAFDSAVDLLHIFDVNVPAVTGLLLPRAPAFVLRYAQLTASPCLS